MGYRSKFLISKRSILLTRRWRVRAWGSQLQGSKLSRSMSTCDGGTAVVGLLAINSEICFYGVEKIDWRRRQLLKQRSVFNWRFFWGYSGTIKQYLRRDTTGQFWMTLSWNESVQFGLESHSMIKLVGYVFFQSLSFGCIRQRCNIEAHMLSQWTISLGFGSFRN